MYSLFGGDDSSGEKEIPQESSECPGREYCSLRLWKEASLKSWRRSQDLKEERE